MEDVLVTGGSGFFGETLMARLLTYVVRAYPFLLFGLFADPIDARAGASSPGT
jgi:nucleoside-diphosphate-sugar epimerase